MPTKPRRLALHAWESGRPTSRDLSFVSEGSVEELQRALFELIDAAPHLRFDAEIVDPATGAVLLVPQAEGAEIRWRVA